MGALTVTERTSDGGAVVVTLSGRADLASEGELDRELTRLGAARPTLLVFDLGSLELMTSLAIGQLVALTQSIRRHGGEVVLASPNSFVGGMLERARLQRFFVLAGTVDQALSQHLKK